MFAAGTAIPLAVLLVGLPWLGSRGVFVGTSLLVPLSLLAAAAVVGGVLAGGSLHRGRRGQLAIAVAYAVGLWPTFAVIGTLSALTGREEAVEIGARLVLAFTVSYILVGCFGSALLGRGWRRTASAASAGAAFGAVGGLFVTGTVLVVTANTALAQFIVAVVGGGGACLLSSALGGWWLCRAGEG